MSNLEVYITTYLGEKIKAAIGRMKRSFGQKKSSYLETFSRMAIDTVCDQTLPEVKL